MPPARLPGMLTIIDPSGRYEEPQVENSVESVPGMPDATIRLARSANAFGSPSRSFIGRLSLQQSRLNRQRAGPYTRRGKDRIRHRRRNGRRGSLADAARGFRALDDVRFDDGRFIHPKRAIVVEIALLDASVLQRDRAVERRGEAEERSAFKLGRDRVRIDDHAAVD